MRIGILTFHNAINYGAVIQCYALMKFLEQRGHKVEVVDYRLEAIEDYRKKNSISALAGIKGIKNKCIFLLTYFLLRKRKQKVINAFDSFLKTKLHLSRLYTCGQDLSALYDFFIFGSDQIWNIKLTNGFDPVFWGQIKKGNAVFATYAASMGEVDVLSDKQWESVANYLKTFDYISVRELALQKCLSNKLGINVDCCIDPTLLSSSEILEAIAVKPKEDNYVYLYNVTDDKYAVAFANRLASSIGCKVVMTYPKPRMRLFNKCRVVEGISPEEFLGYIKYAKLVIGNSFHVIALSLLFGKDFYSLDSHRPERIKNLLKDVGLVDRHVKSTDGLLSVTPVDYSLTKEKLSKMKEQSLLYINKIGL